jgi:hypothetical protein
MEALMNKENRVYSNKSTSIYVQIFGILVGLGGALHGVFETLQGNQPTGGIVLAEIGALTIIPNYLATGIAAIFVSSLVIIWSIGFIDKRIWPPVFIILCILLFLVGGGFAQILVILTAWLVSTQIHNPLSWWERIIPHRIRSIFARLWLPTLILGVLFFTVGFGIWLFVLPPGEVREVTTTHYLVWISLFIGLFFLLIDILFGFSRDIELRA